MGMFNGLGRFVLIPAMIGAILPLPVVAGITQGASSGGMDLGNISAWTAKQTFYTATTSAASINLPHGTAPSSPVNGDLWTTTTGLLGYINSATKQFANLSDAQTWSGQQTFGTSPLKFTHGIISDGNGNGSTTGNARGTGAIDLQTNRSAATQVASGNYSTVIGYRNTAAGQYMAAFGSDNTGSGQNSMLIGTSNNSSTYTNSYLIGSSNAPTGNGLYAIGSSNTGASGYAFGASNWPVSSGVAIGSSNITDVQAVAIGTSTRASVARSLTTGQYSHAVDQDGWYGVHAHASNRFSTSGDAQTVTFYMRQQTTSATPEPMGENDTHGVRVHNFSSSTMWAFHAYIAGTTSGGTSAAYKIEGAIENVGGVTALVGTPTVTVLGEDDAAWDVTVTADNTNDQLDIDVTGAAATNINWTGTLTVTAVST